MTEYKMGLTQRIYHTCTPSLVNVQVANLITIQISAIPTTSSQTKLSRMYDYHFMNLHLLMLISPTSVTHKLAFYLIFPAVLLHCMSLHSKYPTGTIHSSKTLHFLGILTVNCLTLQFDLTIFHLIPRQPWQVDVQS